MTPKKYRWCIGCKHLMITLGESDWSELTAGEPASIVCLKNVFQPMVERDRDEDRTVEQVMSTAKTCAKYSERSVP